MLVKPLKTRLGIYLWAFVACLLVRLGLLITGYNYSKSKGFFIAQDREPMGFGEAVSAMPDSLLGITLAVLVLMIFLVEAIVFIALMFRK